MGKKVGLLVTWEGEELDLPIKRESLELWEEIDLQDGWTSSQLIRSLVLSALDLTLEGSFLSDEEEEVYLEMDVVIGDEHKSRLRGLEDLLTTTLNEKVVALGIRKVH